MIAAIADASQVAAARRQIANYARRIGVSEQRGAQVALAVTELATNLLKHGGGGVMLAGPFDDQDGAGLELLALDKGAGMPDVERCLRDGYSTAGSMGSGLGAVVRQADQVRIYSWPDKGTAVMARFVTRHPQGAPHALIGAAVATMAGETACGDDWAFADAPPGLTLLAVDGTGHGTEAARAAEIATHSFGSNAQLECTQIIEHIHRALMPTRGAAIAVARIDRAARVVRYVGVGNISGVVVSGGRARHMVSHHGTAGHTAPRIREFVYEFTGAPLLILHSDGVTTKWDLADYPGLVAQHPSLIAGVLLRDCQRGRDDASVVVLRAMP